MDKAFSRKIIFFNFLYSIIILLYHADAGVHFSNIVPAGTAFDSVAQRINLLIAGSMALIFLCSYRHFCCIVTCLAIRSEANCKEGSGHC